MLLPLEWDDLGPRDAHIIPAYHSHAAPATTVSPAGQLELGSHQPIAEGSGLLPVKAPALMADGSLIVRESGTPQGGVCPQGGVFVAISAPDQPLTTRITRFDRNKPDGTPNCGHDAMSPRLLWPRAHSIEISNEPPHSPTNADTLQHPQNSQDDRTPDPNRLVPRHEGDQERRDSHHHQRGDERGLAADAVAIKCPKIAAPIGRPTKPCRTD